MSIVFFVHYLFKHCALRKQRVEVYVIRYSTFEIKQVIYHRYMCTIGRPTLTSLHIWVNMATFS